jgi:hypothetical protein
VIPYLITTETNDEVLGANSLFLYQLNYNGTVVHLIIVICVRQCHSVLRINVECICKQWETYFIIDGAASGVTKRRHDVTFPVDVAPRKRSCTFYGVYPKENIVYTGVLQIFRQGDIEGIAFDT